MKECLNCQKPISEYATECPYCKSLLSGVVINESNTYKKI